MARPVCSDEEFIAAFNAGGATNVKALYGVTEPNIYKRRRRLEAALGHPIHAPRTVETVNLAKYPHRANYEIDRGVVLVASDAHYWPNYVSTAHRAFVKACDWLKPALVVMNGDVMDGAQISRHPPIGWETRPSVIQELETCKERLDEIRAAAKNAKLCWPLGNHDARFETRLATVAPEFAKVHGFHLQDHMPEWRPCWAVWINNSTVIKHKPPKGGIHSGHNSTLYAGKTMVCGHDHQLKVTPFNDYGGIRWGVNDGTLAEPYWPMFRDYTEDAPRNWASGFAVLTYHRGRLLWPELVHVIEEGVVEFRGRLYNV